MSVNLFDYAYDLEKALRKSNEYGQLKSLYEQVNADSEARTLFTQFRDIQMQLQEKQMMGQDISEEEVQNAQNTVQQVQQHPLISQLMEAEQRMSMAIAELNKIIMKPLEELYGPMNG
ncbi:cell fate (sporulation/competence/biofilm development) regulator YlbF (YheA/YmcA/DUF963 family) [Oikeobacillus pervagus]|uniref:UPF0342 protein J2S13_001137 n=1 Tax=Oikeobacillus pervagus TaxID=1325931 RepID=A0AAJ1WIL2_9BACI|nr:YlbF family regulator [Oikeobacillus pervagus]MDQ0214740.1 cell fate (sporulation/competence/biofilm development) regulator YlbF (YheA/YmcA/DUF963 family) [Oikeobacillus pervagus]